MSALQEKMKYSKDGFCCLVVTSASEPNKVKGSVEISLQGGKVPACQVSCRRCFHECSCAKL